MIGRPQMYEVRKVETVEEKECLLNKLKEIIKQILRENEQNAKSKRFNCGKGGHFQRNCKAPRNRSRPVSPTRQRVVETLKASGIHYVETRDHWLKISG